MSRIPDGKFCLIKFTQRKHSLLDTVSFNPQGYHSARSSSKSLLFISFFIQLPFSLHQRHRDASSLTIRDSAASHFFVFNHSTTSGPSATQKAQIVYISRSDDCSRLAATSVHRLNLLETLRPSSLARVSHGHSNSVMDWVLRTTIQPGLLHTRHPPSNF